MLEGAGEMLAYQTFINSFSMSTWVGEENAVLPGVKLLGDHKFFKISSEFKTPETPLRAEVKLVIVLNKYGLDTLAYAYYLCLA